MTKQLIDSFPFLSFRVAEVFVSVTGDDFGYVILLRTDCERFLSGGVSA